jgi:DNA-binding NarL/FixJ family response regulator
MGSPESGALVEERSQRLPLTRIILFGMDEDPDCFLRAVHLGIRGYLLKDASALDIIAAVQGVTRGEVVCPPKLCSLLFELVSRELRWKSVLASGQKRTNLGLTHRQRELMRLVEEGLTNKEIAATLNLSEFTVRNHISRVMKRVDADTRYKAVEVIRTNIFSPVH